MSKNITVELNEKEVRAAIKDWVMKNFKLEVKSMEMYTSVRGDYDRGNAQEYVENVICKCK